jgi:hypothetical protein
MLKVRKNFTVFHPEKTSRIRIFIPARTAWAIKVGMKTQVVGSAVARIFQGFRLQVSDILVHVCKPRRF